MCRSLSFITFALVIGVERVYCHSPLKAGIHDKRRNFRFSKMSIESISMQRNFETQMQTRQVEAWKKMSHTGVRVEKWNSTAYGPPRFYLSSSPNIPQEANERFCLNKIMRIVSTDKYQQYQIPNHPHCTPSPFNNRRPQWSSAVDECMHSRIQCSSRQFISYRFDCLLWRTGCCLRYSINLNCSVNIKIRTV